MMKLYVGNLPFSVTEDELRDLFAQHGTVTSATLVMDRETGRPRGFGFVEFNDRSEAESAIEALHEIGRASCRERV
jgi:RNA recognition motif-containing protein